MIELITTVIITGSSVLLFGYWFRYTCLLILSAKTTRDFAGQVAAANQLGFLEVQTQLRATTVNLDSLRDTLDRDYAVLSSMLKQVSGSSEEGSSLETSMLAVNYRVMRSWSQVSRRVLTHGSLQGAGRDVHGDRAFRKRHGSASRGRGRLKRSASIVSSITPARCACRFNSHTEVLSQIHPANVRDRSPAIRASLSGRCVRY